MNVGIDVTSLIYGRGVSRYTANLVRSLLHSTSTSLSLYGSSFRQYSKLESEIKSLLAENPTAKTRINVKLQKYPPSVQNLLWNTLNQNSIASQLPKVQVFHSWDWLQPPDKKLPIVSTIHDLAMLRFPETAHPQILKMHQVSWQKLKARQSHLIAISRATKQDVVELLEYPRELVHVVYEALPTEFAAVTQTLDATKTERLKTKLQLDKPYILFVGTREPRKNIQRLIQAWEPLAKDIQLIIAGEVGWDQTEKIQSENLRFLGRVSDQELAVLYREAQLFAYPSLYEGFGLPILEAFYSGTPVVTSNLSSMEEVAGNAAALIDPLSVESLRAGIETILKEKPEQKQQRRQKMKIRLQMFDWQRVAQETLKVYQKAIDDQS